MGRQVNFYFVKEDELSLLSVLEKEKVLFFRHDPTNMPNPQTYTELALEPVNGARHCQAFISREIDAKMIRMECIGVTGQFHIDGFSSPVIEFTRSGYRPESNTIVSGRLWYEHTFWDKDKNGQAVLISKDEELKELYDRLAKWIKKYCKRLPNGNYIGPHAAELYAKGAKLSP